MTAVAAEHTGEPGLIVSLCVVKLYFGIEFAELSIIQWMIQRETSVMNADQTVQLINLLSKKRTESGLSVAEVARRAHIDVAAVWRIEQGMIAAPRAESLIAIGGVLGIPPADLFTIVGWLRDDELPTLEVYLGAKYPGLPPEGIQAIEGHTATVVKKYGIDVNDDDGHRLTTKES
jgi:transcriptional regulator with XRE-family HTH domain